MRYWLVQANPDYIDIIGYLRDYGHQPPDWWTKENTRKIEVGDMVFVWKAKGRERARCVLGTGKVVPLGTRPEAYRLQILDYVKPGARAKAEAWLKEPYVEVCYKRLVLDDPVWEQQLLDNGVTEFRFYNFRTWAVTKKDAWLIDELIGRHQGVSYPDCQVQPDP